MTKGPRPWYLSITAVWSDANNCKSFESLKSCIKKLCSDLPFPFHHIPIPSKYWDSSVLAIAKFSESQSGKSATVQAEEVFHGFLSSENLIKHLRKDFTTFSVTPRQLRCYDDGTTVQFYDNPALTELRERLKPALIRAFDHVARDRSGIQSLLQDEKKSRGPRFFGSIARSPHPEDQSVLRWEKELPKLKPMKFNGAYFVVSDEAFMNPHTKRNFISIGQEGAWGRAIHSTDSGEASL